MLLCKHCRNEMHDGERVVIVRAGKWRAYVHRSCTVAKLPRNMFARKLLTQIG